MCKILNSIPSSPTQNDLADDFDNWYRTLKLETALQPVPVDSVETYPIITTTETENSFISYFPENSGSCDMSTLTFPQLLVGGDLLGLGPILSNSANENTFSNINALPNTNSLLLNSRLATTFRTDSTTAFSFSDSIVKTEEEKSHCVNSGDVCRKRKSSSPTAVASAEPIPEALAVKRQKQNEAARKSRQKKLNMLQEAQECAEKAMEEVSVLKKRLLLLEAEKTAFIEREKQMKLKFRMLFQNIEGCGVLSQSL
jgi:hypothetical protein